MARADWLRRHPAPGSLAQAIRLDPGNAYGYTLQAELLEQQGRPAAAERAWADALQRSPRNVEALIRLASLAEQRGDAGEAERLLLEAGRLSHTWLPRWALANFYLRHGRPLEFRAWAKESLLRASSDVVAVFPLFDEAGLTPQILLKEVLPCNRQVLTAWLTYRLAHKQDDDLFQAGQHLVNEIPQGSIAWPGLDKLTWRQPAYAAGEAEKSALLGATDRLRDLGKFDQAVLLWNFLGSRRALATDSWTPSAPLLNSHFRYPLQSAGLDWRISAAPGVRILTDTQEGRLTIRLNGSQREQVATLIDQPAILPKAGPYRLVIESRSTDLIASNGLRWEIRDAAILAATLPVGVSSDWKRSTVNLPPAGYDRTVDVALGYNRLPGTLRSEGSVEFRLVGLELLP